MISKLPRWVEYGAFVLALVAGCVNAVGLLGFKHQSVSHLSGIATRLGADIVQSAFPDVLDLTTIIISFLIGSAISGYFLRSEALKLGRNYSGLLVLEAMLLFIAVYLLSKDGFGGIYFASVACGLQNALATTYSGAVVRTTHITGIVTDLGIMLGAKLRGEAFDRRKLFLFLLIIIGFIVGGIVGTYTFSLLQFNALFIPASICLLLAVSYSVYNAKYDLH
ncbi:DUF1275 domain-containing protein [Psychromonas sp.]|nr:DUF1275 domain-containing protein [Psychromonas sp.]